MTDVEFVDFLFFCFLAFDSADNVAVTGMRSVLAVISYKSLSVLYDCKKKWSSRDVQIASSCTFFMSLSF